MYRRYLHPVTFVAVAFLIGAVVLFWTALRPSSHPNPDELEYNNRISGDVVEVPYSFLAVLHINQLDPAKRQADVQLRLFLPTLYAHFMVDESDGRKVFRSVFPPHDFGGLKSGQPAFVITKPGWSHAQLDVRVTTPNQNWDGQMPLWLLGYPSAAIFRAGPVPKDPALLADDGMIPQEEQQLTLDLTGDPADYPDDQYVLTATMSISLPPPLVYLAGNGIQQTFSPHLAAVASAGLPFTLKEAGFANQDGVVTVQFGRPPGTKFLVWLVALAPLLLLAAGLATVRRRRAALNLATAAALLAILPLRQVLVPPDVGGFTRIDALLAAELVTFIAVAALAHLHIKDPDDKTDQQKRRDEITAAVITGITTATAENLNRVTSATAESLNRLIKLEVRQAYRSSSRLNRRRRVQIVRTRVYRRRSRPQPPVGNEEKPDPG